MTLDELKNKLKNGEPIEFEEVMQVIETYYDYIPSRFVNGIKQDKVINEAGKNEGSCKIFAFARLHQLTEAQTLACFGHFYRDDVLKHPENFDHANIRMFMRDGWQGIEFKRTVLVEKQ